MTSQDGSHNFEERDDQTVFRPMPGAVRPGPPKTDAGPAPAAPNDQTIFRPSPLSRRPGASDQAFDRASLLNAPAAPPPPPPPRQAAIQTLDLEAPNENPILQAAGPLLLLLGRLRTSLLRASGSALIPQIAAAVEKSEKEMLEAGVAVEDVTIAKLVLCATADEVLANLPGDDCLPAQRSGLMTRFFGENDGNRRFFEELDRAAKEPKANFALLQLFHACLALGFQGAQQTLPGGAARLQDVRDDLYRQIQALKPAVTPLPLSPRFQVMRSACGFRCGRRRVSRGWCSLLSSSVCACHSAIGRKLPQRP
jgi:type VI secretion system protein ImpK